VPVCTCRKQATRQIQDRPHKPPMQRHALQHLLGRHGPIPCVRCSPWVLVAALGPVSPSYSPCQSFTAFYSSRHPRPPPCGCGCSGLAGPDPRSNSSGEGLYCITPAQDPRSDLGRPALSPEGRVARHGCLSARLSVSLLLTRDMYVSKAARSISEDGDGSDQK
jgi:hypothetical protein